MLLSYDTATEDKDRLLRALVRLSQRSCGGEPRMAVIVCLLPGIRSAVRRYQDILGRSDAWGEMLVALWDQIGTFNLARRPSRVAANLLWDATNRLVRAVRRERAWLDHIEVGGAGEELAAADPFLCHTEGLAGVLLDDSAGGVLAPTDALLISATRLAGIRLADAAVLLGISYEAAKKRRQRAEALWVEWWAPERRPTFPALVDRRSGPRAA